MPCKNSRRARGVLFLLLLVGVFFRGDCVSAILPGTDTLRAFLTAAPIVAPGQTLTYTLVVSNVGTSTLGPVTIEDLPDPLTTLIAGSLSGTPVAAPDAYTVIGNVPLSVVAPGLLANDFDTDASGPPVSVVSAAFVTGQGAAVSIQADGSFTYNPARGFRGVDTFTYRVLDGEGFEDLGTVSVTVKGMVWFVNSASPTAGDGRLGTPYNSLAAFRAVNTGSGSNPGPGDTVFLFSGSYAGPVGLLAGQRLVGQGSGAPLAIVAGLEIPPGSALFPLTGGRRPVIVGTGGGIQLSSGNIVRGLDVRLDSGNGLSGLAVGALSVSEVSVSTASGIGVALQGGVVDVRLSSVSASGGQSGIRLVQTQGRFEVLGDGGPAQNGSGGIIRNTLGNGIHLENVEGILFSRMTVSNAVANGLYGTGVNGLAVDGCAFLFNGSGAGLCGIRLGDPAGGNGLVGGLPGTVFSTRISNTLVRASGEMNIALFNNAGVLSQLDLSGVELRDTTSRPQGADGFLIQTRGTASAVVRISGCSFVSHRTQGIQASALERSALSVRVVNSGFTNDYEGIVLANDLDAALTYEVSSNRFFNASGASGAAVVVANYSTASGSASTQGTLQRNSVVGGGADNHLFSFIFSGLGNNTLLLDENTLASSIAQFSGVALQAGEPGAGLTRVQATMSRNSVSLGTKGSHGLDIQSRDKASLCLTLEANVSTTGGAGLSGIRLRQRDLSILAVSGLPLATSNPTLLANYVALRNPGATVATALDGKVLGGDPCVLPLIVNVRPPPIPAPVVADLSLPAFPRGAVASTDTNNPGDVRLVSALPERSVSLPPPGASLATLPSLPSGKSFTLTFAARVASSVPDGTCSIANQALVSTPGFSTVASDDPRSPASADATVSRIPGAPVAVTLPGVAVPPSSAILNGRLNPCGGDSTWWFEYGASVAYGLRTPSQLLPEAAGQGDVSVSVEGMLPGRAYHFRLVSTNRLGKRFGTNQRLAVPIPITTQPLSLLACEGGQAAFTVSTAIAGVSYQWQQRPPGAPAFVNIPGATSPTLTLDPVSGSLDGFSYRVALRTVSVETLSDVAVLSVIAVPSPTLFFDFNSGLPVGTGFYGNAGIDTQAGTLELNLNLADQTGAFLTSDPAPGYRVEGFAARFQVRIQTGRGSFGSADGFSFNWATDLPNSTYAVAEEGEGSGLRVTFDTYDNGGGEAPAIEVWWGTRLVGRRAVTSDFLIHGGTFAEVGVRLRPGGLLDLSYGCQPIFNGLSVPGYTPLLGARFGLGGRTGAYFESHSIDNLAIGLSLAPVDPLPRIDSLTFPAPDAIRLQGLGVAGARYRLESSGDLESWAFVGFVSPDATGAWQLDEAAAGSAAVRFYRLRQLPQMPAGLVDWYQGEGDGSDSWGPLSAQTLTGVTFIRGQRGRGFVFSPVDGHAVLGGSPIPPPWTAGFWVRRLDAAGPSAALLSDPFTAIKLEQWPSTRRVGFTQFGVADHLFNTIVPARVWTHLVLVAAEGTTTLYLNGNPLESLPVQVDLPRGAISRPGVDVLNGSLDEITLFDRALSRGEVLQLLNATRGP